MVLRSFALSLLALATITSVRAQTDTSSPHVPPIHQVPPEAASPEGAPVLPADELTSSTLEAITASVLPTEADFLSLAPDGTVTDDLKRLVELRGYSFVAPTDSDEDIRPGAALPEVRLNLFNRHHDFPIAFEIRTLFFRHDGSLMDATPWTEGTTPPRKQFRYRATAFTPLAARELVQLRRLRLLDPEEARSATQRDRETQP